MAKNQTRREELLDVAINLFAANGYAGTSIRDIANTTGHSVSNVYHYFKTKEDLWLAILEHSSSGIAERLRIAAQMPGEPIERFARMLHAHLKESVKHHREAKIFFIDEERLSNRGKRLNQRVQKEILEIYVKQLSALQDAGVIQARNLRVLAFNILGVINWYLRWKNRVPDMSDRDVHDEIINFIVRGIGGE